MIKFCTCFGAALLAIFASCGNSELPSGAQASNANAAVVIPARVVVIGPSTTETLLELGLRDHIAAVSDFCVDPRAEGLPRIGGQFDPNLERIASLDPDYMIVQGGNPKVLALCDKLDIPFLQLGTDSVSGWLDEVRKLSTLFDVEDAGDELLNDFQTEISRLKESAPEVRPTVAILIGRDGARSMIAVGRGSFLHELLEIAGGRNVFDSNERAYFDLAEEALVDAVPEFLFDLSVMTGAASGKNNESSANESVDIFSSLRNAYPQIPAVQNNHLYALQQDYIFLPGPRMLLTLKAFRERLSQNKIQLTPQSK